MTSSRETLRPPACAPRELPLRPRLAATRQLAGQRRRSELRLRRSLWISLLAHAAALLVLLPLSVPRPEAAIAAVPPPLQVLRIEPKVPIVTPELAQFDPAHAPELTPKPEPRPDDDPIEPKPPKPQLDLPHPDDTPPPPEPPQPEPPERLEFLRAHMDASPTAPDTDRISTQDQQVEHERVSPARAQVSDGSSDRGMLAGYPQQATRAGARPQLPAPSTPAELQAMAQARHAFATPRPPQAQTLREDEHPCPGSAQSHGPCDALADAQGSRQGVHDRGEPQRHDGDRSRSQPQRQAAPASEREGWKPLAVRLPGQVTAAQPFPEALLPDRPASPGLATPQDALLQATASQPQRHSKEARDSHDQRREQAHAQRQARAQGSSLPDPLPRDSELADHRSPPPEPELRFLIEPLDLMRQEREREQQAQASERNRHKQRRRAAQGSARPTVASPSGSQAAAGGSVVSPIDPPQVLDVKTVLSARSHPLSEVLQVLDDQLRSSWSIPFDIRVSGIVGTTGLELVLDKRGRIRDVSTPRPSGHAQLDELARSAIPDRIEDFGKLLEGEAREAFPSEGLHVYYEFEYRDSPVAGVL